jgi:hypothetical protein
MADPFLIAHGVAPRQFELGGSWTPISIRDQMVRARMFATRALREGLINPGRALAVAGAGAGGATLAIIAAQERVPTLLIEQSPQAFGRQARCVSRWVDPAQYDWPHPLWGANRYPSFDPPMPLPWGSAPASRLALRWQLQLQQAIAQLPNLTVAFGHSVQNVRGAPGGVEVLYGPTRTPGQWWSGAAFVSAIGFGTEKCDVQRDFRGWGFWQSDTIGQPNFGLSSARIPSVLISGGGDGALQDFIRATTGLCSVREVVDRLPVPWSRIEHHLMGIEDELGRAHLWGAGAADDHEVMQQLHDEYRLQVDHLRSHSSWRLLGPALGDLVPPERTAVELVHPCTHFGRSYALNRLITFLIAAHLEEQVGRHPIQPGERVHGIRGMNGHACQKDPYGCHGQPHAVEFVASPDCRDPSISTIVVRTSDHNVIVVRHGTAPPTYVYSGEPLGPPRQILPYHAPV